MKKQTLKEESSRIRKMMGINEDFEYPKKDKEPLSVDDVVDYISTISSKIEELAQEMSTKLSDTEFWPYVKPMYSGLRSVSDMEGNYTRSDEKSENVSRVIELLDDVFEDESNNEPSDDDIFNGFGREGGISYLREDDEKYYELLNKEPYFGSHNNRSWVGASGRNYGSVDFSGMGDFTDEVITSYDDLISKYPEIRTSKYSDKWYGTNSNDGFNNYTNQIGELVVRRRIPNIGDQSSVENDDYDQKMERNYGVED